MTFLKCSATLLAAILACTALPAQAAKLNAAQLAEAKTHLAATCSEVVTPEHNPWMQAGDGEAVCTCAAGQAAAKWKTVKLADPAQPTKEDSAALTLIEQDAIASCRDTRFATVLAKRTTSQCMAAAPRIPLLNGLSPTDLQSACTCAGTRYTSPENMRRMRQVTDQNEVRKLGTQMMMKALESCVTK